MFNLQISFTHREKWKKEKAALITVKFHVPLQGDGLNGFNETKKNS